MKKNFAMLGLGLSLFVSYAQADLADCTVKAQAYLDQDIQSEVALFGPNEPDLGLPSGGGPYREELTKSSSYSPQAGTEMYVYMFKITNTGGEKSTIGRVITHSDCEEFDIGEFNSLAEMKTFDNGYMCDKGRGAQC